MQQYILVLKLPNEHFSERYRRQNGPSTVLCIFKKRK